MMLPNGWKKVGLFDVVSIESMLVDPKKEPYSEMNLIAPDHIQSETGVVLALVPAKEQHAISGKYLVKEGDVIYSKIRPYLKKTCRATEECLCSADMYPFTVSDQMDASYLLHMLLSETFTKYANTCSARTGIPKINREDLALFQFYLPPIEEQKKIAATLSVWDSAIEKMEKLIEAKSHNFKLLMEKLVVKQSLKKQTKTYSIKELFDVVNRKNKVGNTNVLTSSAQYGLVNQQEYYKKSIASSDISGYYLLEKGDFAYNRSYSTGYPYGVIKRLDKYESGVLSTLYLCMTLKKDYRSLSDYFVFLFESGYLNNQLALICREGARNHGLLNVSKDDFFNMKVQLPSEKEQQNIVCILQNHSCELSLLKQQLENYKKQKQGLMQKLLTGQWRVK